MSQPFRQGQRYDSQVWEGVRIALLEDRLEICHPQQLRTLSNAVHTGGLAEANVIVNWKVPLHYAGTDPAKDTASQLSLWGYSPERTIGLLTAAKLTHASIAEVEGDCFKLLCVTTAGTRNAARAGLPRATFSAYSAGTINTVLLVDGQMTDSAMTNAIITYAEAKAAALSDLFLTDSETNGIATGTTTDAVVIGVSGNPLYRAVHAYAGTATTIGNAIGRLVYETVTEACRTQHES
ncbi:adenosylcobinamide amidohydrolase [Paenibacillus glycanilyticus]|uniref:adenosylcobinamide amidohydrolase n=1 Tax=Paenibacillus glycanilyticus TaxID=126569 RepID=UPI00203C0AC9|nr:adenosylcobinamide amidohydrolase [Paenibacillus glycanilyticus]MCM3625846.1 adenosylcobinamide amidohydrolase [Paenibacillus glycanilyticus]